MAVKGYVTLSLPTDLIDRVDAFLEKNTWGFRSRAEMVTAAIREFLQRTEAETRKK